MALLMSLVFLLLLTMIGLSSLQNAILQEKMSASLTLNNRAFQAAEAALRLGENAVRMDDYRLSVCANRSECAPPAESAAVSSAGFNSVSAVTWIATGEGFYGVQNLGASTDAVNLPINTVATLYRVTAVGLAGHSRSVLESIYAKY